MPEVEGQMRDMATIRAMAYGVGNIITDVDYTGEQALSAVRTNLTTMGCDLPIQYDRLETLANLVVDGQPIDRDGFVFKGLVGAASVLLLLRDSSDLQSEAERNDTFARPNAELLTGFMDGAAAGHFPRGGIERIVRQEIATRRREAATRSSYSAVGAVAFYDEVLDLTKLTSPIARVMRTVGGLRTRQTYGANVHSAKWQNRRRSDLAQ